MFRRHALWVPRSEAIPALRSRRAPGQRPRGAPLRADCRAAMPQTSVRTSERIPQSRFPRKPGKSASHQRCSSQRQSGSGWARVRAVARCPITPEESSRARRSSRWRAVALSRAPTSLRTWRSGRPRQPVGLFRLVQLGSKASWAAWLPNSHANSHSLRFTPKHGVCEPAMCRLRMGSRVKVLSGLRE
jgi:hypothetical protein